MKIRTVLMFFMILLICATASQAQRKVYVCENYTNSGQPIGADFEFTMPETGGAAYVLYTNGGDPIAWKKMYMLVDRYENGAYKEVETKEIVPDNAKAWVVVDYAFFKAGSYKLTFTNQNGDKLASTTVDIIVKNSTSTDNVSGAAEVIFCTAIDENGGPVNVSDLFYINPEKGSYVYIYIDNGAPFNTAGLIVDVYKGNDFGEFVESKEYDITPSWEATYFKYTFREEGKYKFIIYNDEEVPLANGIVSIEYK